MAHGNANASSSAEPVLAFYGHTLRILKQSPIPFLVGGAYALARYTGIQRHTKDIDVFVRPADAARTLQTLSEAGYQTELTFPHWLGKAYRGDFFIDIIFSSGNGLCRVDNGWFSHAPCCEVVGVFAHLTPPEEMIWSKAFILERERYDGADVAHLIRALAERLDWHRLLDRFGPHAPILLAHIVLFEFIYPSETKRVPDWVREDLVRRYQAAVQTPSPDQRDFRGTLLSRAQYFVDIQRWGYRDARLLPEGTMTPDQVRAWTEAIEPSDVPVFVEPAPELSL